MISLKLRTEFCEIIKFVSLFLYLTVFKRFFTESNVLMLTIQLTKRFVQVQMHVLFFMHFRVVSSCIEAKSSRCFLSFVFFLFCYQFKYSVKKLTSGDC